MTSATDILSDIFGAAFKAQGLDPALGLVRVSDRPDLAMFQCNGAMAAGKQAGKNPREIADAIIKFLQEPPYDRENVFEKLEIAGPGFINIDVANEFINNNLANNSRLNTLGVAPTTDSPTVLLDYGGPNIAKAMHVGHLRSAIIGDTLRRMYVFGGYKALGDIHLGDWGLPMGQVISELEIRHPDWPYFDEAAKGPYPEKSPVSMADLEEIYPAASQACKDDEDRLELARKATLDLQKGRPGYRALWKHFVDVSIEGIKKNFDALNVQFDLWNGEASVHKYIEDMVKGLVDQKFAVMSDGALVVPVAKNDDKKEVPPLILHKTDGAVMYSTTDLATLVERVQAYSPDKIVYVVDQRQSLHFEQVFRAAQISKIVPARTELLHAGFGTMNGKDGKPFKTREGGIMKLEDLIEMGTEKARQRLQEAVLAQGMNDVERDEVAMKVAVAAIKFADLQNNRTADYVFDLDRLTSFEGKTGPYLLYQTVRIQSLLRKANYKTAPADYSFAVQDLERPLALLLLEFPSHFEQALQNNAPHILCDYAYSLAQNFSSFYGTCHILSEEDEALKKSRLNLSDVTRRQLELILNLLGIKIPARM